MQEKIFPKGFETKNTIKQGTTSVELLANGMTSLIIKISEHHKLEINVRQTVCNFKERFLVNMQQAHVKIDSIDIFTINGMNVQLLQELKILQHERENYDTFVLSCNAVWAVCLSEFSGVFPYNFDFSDAIQNELVTLLKWLKNIHNYKKELSDSTLPPDIIFQVKEFLLEMSDDPFEVKLRENYVLLMDEYFESLKRKEVFDKKLAILCADRLLLPIGMVEELNATLVKKNSETYIHRSKKIAEMQPRTRLIGWAMTDLEVMAMADTSIHGTEKVSHMIQEIDPDSPWPEDGLEFVTYWCRGISLSCTEWRLNLRDYPQPMFHIKAMHLFGFLCGAEQVPPRRARRDVDIDLGHPFGKATLQRSMNPLKFYHDFDWELDYLCYAFGPCWYVFKFISILYTLKFQKVFELGSSKKNVCLYYER